MRMRRRMKSRMRTELRQRGRVTVWRQRRRTALSGSCGIKCKTWAESSDSLGTSSGEKQGRK